MTSFDFSTVKALFLDLDGVLWEGSQPIGNLGDIFNKLEQAGVFPVFGTNNSTKTPAEYQEKFSALGIRMTPEQLISPAIGAAERFRKEYPAGCRVHVFGSDALREYLRAEGFCITDESPDVVLVSLDQSMTYAKVALAMRLIDEGATFYATNLDHVLASEHGFLPGGGVLVKAVETCTGQAPIVIGKPEPYLIEIAIKRFGFSQGEIVAVGDRYDTDILGGIRAGCRTVMVLTGVDSAEAIQKYPDQPDLILRDLNELVDHLLVAARNEKENE